MFTAKSLEILSGGQAKRTFRYYEEYVSFLNFLFSLLEPKENLFIKEYTNTGIQLNETSATVVYNQLCFRIFPQDVSLLHYSGTWITQGYKHISKHTCKPFGITVSICCKGFSVLGNLATFFFYCGLHTAKEDSTHPTEFSYIQLY